MALPQHGPADYKQHASQSQPLVVAQAPTPMQPLAAAQPLAPMLLPTSTPPLAAGQPPPPQPPAPLQPLGSGPAPFEGERERPGYAMPGNVQPPQMLGAAAPAAFAKPFSPSFPTLNFGGGLPSFSALASTDRTPHFGAGGDISEGEPSLSERARPVPGAGLVNMPGIINNPAMPAVAGPASAFRPPLKAPGAGGAKLDGGGAGMYRPPWQGRLR